MSKRPARCTYEADDNWRKRLRTSAILNRLENHIFGEIELSNTQIKAAEIILRKTLPDLSHTTGDIKHSFADDLGDRLAQAREAVNASREPKLIN